MMRRPSLWAASVVVPAVLGGCSSNAENDPFVTVITVVAYAAAIGLFGFLVYRAIWGEEGPR